jgi:predicted ATPase
LPALSTALHIPGDPGEDDDGGLSRLCTFIQNKNSLIVLDNMEHLTGCADSVQTMLTTAPRLNLLITSRERLNLPAEWCLEVGGMSYPFGSESGFEDYSAVQLFLHTARRVKANFQIAPGDRAAITHICRLVEGMPLGIELAATWVRLLSPGDILREIENSLDFLTSSQRGIPERHRSLRAIYESSQEMLTSNERDGFHRLALIPGSFTREVASQEAGVNLPLLSALVDKSFIRYHPNGRYDLHEVLRKYASENQHFGYNADTYGR